MARFVRRSDSQSSYAYFAMSYEATIKPHALSPTFKECLGIYEIHFQIHVEEQFGVTPLKSTDDRQRSTTGARCGRRPEQI